MTTGSDEVPETVSRPPRRNRDPIPPLVRISTPGPIVNCFPGGITTLPCRVYGLPLSSQVVSVARFPPGTRVSALAEAAARAKQARASAAAAATRDARDKALSQIPASPATAVTNK